MSPRKARQKKRVFVHTVLMTATFSLLPAMLHASGHAPSATLLGPLGLNTTPGARMDEPGTIRAGISTLDPYLHGVISAQIARPLAITLRQSAEISGMRANPDRLYPGMDAKLRLREETAHGPEIALGLQSAAGHKRMAGEYIALSKRYGDFDFTFGMGWGRLGSAGHIKNPLRIFGPHFREARPDDGEMPNGPGDWFTGKTAGIFGGMEFFLPVSGLSLKLDYNAESYSAERAAIAGFSRPAPWGASLNYTRKNVAASFGMQGTDKLMGRISLQAGMEGWPLTGKKYSEPPHFPLRRGLALAPERIRSAAKTDDLPLSVPYEQDGILHANLALSPYAPAPQQIGRAARSIATHGGPDAKAVEISPMILNLRGPTVRLMRPDLERALTKKQGSPEELWTNTTFSQAAPAHERRLPGRAGFSLTLDNALSLSEEDHGLLYRTSLLAHAEISRIFKSFTIGTAGRLNIKDNLKALAETRSPALLPVRSDIDLFTQDRLSLESSYLNWTSTPAPDLHTSVTFGYLEEMYTGLGGEVLYRPFDSRFALGAELWQLFRRNPDSLLHLGLNGDHVLSGHIGAWYDVPRYNLTLSAKAGRYLAEDIGATLALDKKFRNGASLSAYITVTDSSDADPFGGVTHAWQGLSLSLPLGSFRYLPDGSNIRIAAHPFGRDAGQTVQSPLKLYDLTENLTLDHLSRHWGNVLE